MKSLFKEIKLLEKSPVSKKIDKRLEQFSSFRSKSTKQWFSELCFCILTANSKAKTSIAIQKQLRAKGFCECAAGDIRKCIMKHKHRFHNNKTRYIIEARKHIDIKDKVIDLVKEDGYFNAREWLVKNIKGIGYKEASHFLRNVGYFDLAILDRHILNLMSVYRFIKQRPKQLNKKNYLAIEKKFKTIADNLAMSMAELDMYMWYMKTGEVLK